ncbi:hypothetical protein GCM10009609_32980 [Pseudonocardia aurantiaca]
MAPCRSAVLRSTAGIVAAPSGRRSAPGVVIAPSFPVVAGWSDSGTKIAQRMVARIQVPTKRLVH